MLISPHSEPQISSGQTTRKNISLRWAPQSLWPQDQLWKKQRRLGTYSHQSLLFPSPWEKSKEKLTPLELGAGARAESSSREQTEPRHSRGQPCTTGSCSGKNTLLSVCAALLTGLRDQTQSGTTSPTLGFFDTLSHYI